MKLRRISSLLTVFYKFILPPVFALSNLDLFLNNRLGMVGEVPVIVCIFPFIFEGYLLWYGWGVKWVAIDEVNDGLCVSNYRKEISIPLSHIVDVTESIWSKTGRIKIHLSESSEFGNKIVFFGTYRGGWLAGPRPIVKELKELGTKARAT